MRYFKSTKQRGQVLIISLIFMLIILVLAASLLGFVFQNVHATRKAIAKEQALQLAEATIDKAVWQLNQTAGTYTGETGTVLGTGVFDVSIASISSSRREITGTGYVPNKTSPLATRKVKVEVSIETTTVSFIYGLHVGKGGLLMENSSKVVGSIYSHGAIQMKNSPNITGDVFAATTSQISGANTPTISGSVYAYGISNLTIGGNANSTTSLNSATVSGHAYADTIINSNITRNAYYFTGISGSTVGGTLHPSTPAPGQLPEVAFPISDAQIESWKTQAEAGGVHIGPCPYVLSSGTTNLGPIKINCDFIVQNDAQVIINGPIWVSGSVDFKNTAIIRLVASYGARSEVIIADNPANRLTSSKITVQNTAQVLGSGTAGSYLSLISQNNSAESGGSEAAITPKNSADASIYYALHGKILIENSTGLKEATAYLIHMKNNSTLTYESGLSSTLFTVGPGASWSLVRGTWREIK